MLFWPAILAGAAVMGVLLGALGGGGSILAVPTLVYLGHLDPKQAIAVSLLVVGTTSLIGALTHARAGNVVYKTGAIFGAFGMAGAYAGGRIAEFVPGAVLLGLFALLMVVTSVMMLRPSKPPTPSDKPRSIAHIAADGLGVGFITGLVGAGGGFLVVPALAILGGLDMRKAIGTSLMVIAMKSFAGFAGFAGHVEIDWLLAGSFTTIAIAGSVAGFFIAKRMEDGKLRKSFGAFVLVLGVLMLGAQLF